MQRNDIRDIFARLILQENGCALWPGSCYPNGYPKVSYNGRHRLVYRLIYEHYVGRVPDGWQLDHLCRTRRCCNFAHLEAVPQRVNLLRGEGWAGQNARKTHCPQGHPYAGDNLHIRPKGDRSCRQCHREAELRRYHASRS